MGDYTVKEVARLSGVSVRTLHHYDEVGLLKPGHVGANGYRYYGRDQLLRLQQILFHRELGLPLGEIRQLLDTPDFDRVAALKVHRDRLAASARRTRQLLRTIDRTLAALEGATIMDDKDLYDGFTPEKQAEHEAWLTARYGGDMAERIEASKARLKGSSRADFERQKAAGEEIEAAFAKALADGAPAGSDHVQTLTRRWAEWIATAWGRAPDAAAFAGLGQLYQEHPDFRARFDGRTAGLTDYLAEAMRIYAERELP